MDSFHGNTLTDHFKAALQQTQHQLQSGPNPISSASRIGLTSDGGRFGAMNNINNNFGGGGLDLGDVCGGGGGGGGGNGNNSIFGAGKGNGSINGNNAGGGGNKNIEGAGVERFFANYGKWIFFLIVIVGGIALWLWWSSFKKGKRKSNSEGGKEEDTKGINDLDDKDIAEIKELFSRRHASRQLSLPPPQPQPTQLTQPPLQPTNPTHPTQPTQGGILNAPNNFPTPNFNLRETQQNMSNLRGIDFANPNLTGNNNMRPIATRTDNNPNTNGFLPPPPPQHPQYQQPPSQQPQYPQPPSQQPQPQYQQQPSQQPQYPQPQYQQQQQQQQQPQYQQQQQQQQPPPHLSTPPPYPIQSMLPQQQPQAVPQQMPSQQQQQMPSQGAQQQIAQQQTQQVTQQPNSSDPNFTPI